MIAYPGKIPGLIDQPSNKFSSRIAPKGGFRVIGVDTFDKDGGDWVEGNFKTLGAAKRHADKKTKGKEMLKMHVYDDTGKHLYEAGTY